MSQNRKNLANGLLASAVSPTDTILVLQTGYGAGMPDVPFYLTATPFGQLSTRGNSEIVNVTARTGDTLTIERAQKETTARSFSAGDIVSNSIYADASFDSLDVDGDIYSNGKKVPTFIPSKYTDANGWTVYDNGAWKEYCYSFIAGPGPSYEFLGIKGPVGIDLKTVTNFQLTWLGDKSIDGADFQYGYVSFSSTIIDSGTMNIYRNVTVSSNSRAGRVYIRIIK